MWLSPNEKGDYLYGGDGQDPVNFAWKANTPFVGLAHKQTSASTPPLNNPNCDLTALNCSIEQMEQLPIETRIRWMHDFQMLYQTKGWFNNIEGILQTFQEKNLVRPAENPNYPGSYFSWVDAYILHAIQDGKSRQIKTMPSPGDNVAGPLWKRSFVDLALPGTSDQDLKQDWGHAEQSATTNGRILAEQVHADTGAWGTAFSAWLTFDWAGDRYRQITGTPNGGGKLGSVFFNALCGGELSDNCKMLGYNFGEYFTDPRSQFGNTTPTTIAGKAIYFGMYYDQNIGAFLDQLYYLAPK